MRNMSRPSAKNSVIALVAFLLIAAGLVAGLIYLSADVRNSLQAIVLIVQTTIFGQQTKSVQHQTSAVLPRPIVGKAATTVATKVSAPAIIPKSQPGKAPKVITTVKDRNNMTLEIIDEPIPEDCYPEMHADYDGYAVQWGLGHKTRSAAECCRRCKEFKPPGDVPHKCNMWIWCGDPSGVCWTMDIHTHTTGDCWLKYQATWDGEVDRSKTNLKVNHRGKFTPEFRAEHKTSPEYVPWVAGLVRTGNLDAKPASTKKGA
mmetsp:Transcript_19406/g.42030  ORF Transcript_19406/g.42030 Transcript_19406/m.42030 type:complete len:260 (+) Transcript_19406:126-905(+)